MEPTSDYSKPINSASVLSDPNYVNGDYNFKTDALDKLEEHNLKYYESKYGQRPGGVDAPENAHEYGEKVLAFRAGLRNQRYKAIQKEHEKAMTGIAEEFDVPAENVAGIYDTINRGDKADLSSVDRDMLIKLQGFNQWHKGEAMKISEHTKKVQDTPWARNLIKDNNGVAIGESKVFTGADGKPKAVIDFYKKENDEWTPGRVLTAVGSMGMTESLRAITGQNEEDKGLKTEAMPLNTDIDEEIKRQGIRKLEKQRELDVLKKQIAEERSNPFADREGQGATLAMQQNQITKLENDIRDSVTKEAAYRDPDKGMTNYLHDQVKERVFSDPAFKDRIPNGANFVESLADDSFTGVIQKGIQIGGLARLGYGKLTDDTRKEKDKTNDSTQSILETAQSLDMVRSVHGLGRARNDDGVAAMLLTTASDEVPMLALQMFGGKYIASVATRAASGFLAKTVGVGAEALAVPTEVTAAAVARSTQRFGQHVGAFVGSLPSSAADAVGNLGQVYDKADQLEAYARTLPPGPERDKAMLDAQKMDDSAAGVFAAHFITTAALEYVPADNFLKRFADDLPISQKLLRMTSPAATAAARTQDAIGKWNTIRSRFDRFMAAKVGAKTMDAVVQGSAEAFTEMTQTVSDNQIANMFYDENREMFEGMGDAGFAGFFLGLATDFVGRKAPQKSIEFAHEQSIANEETATQAVNHNTRNFVGMSVAGVIAPPVQAIVKQQADGKFIVDEPDLPIDADPSPTFETAEEAAKYAENIWENYGKKRWREVFNQTDYAKNGGEEAQKELDAELAVTSAWIAAAANGASKETLWKAYSRSPKFREAPGANQNQDSAIPYLDKLLGNENSKTKAEYERYKSDVAKWLAEAPGSRGEKPNPPARVAVAMNFVNNEVSNEPVEVDYPNVDEAHGNIMSAIKQMSLPQLKADLHTRKGRIEKLSKNLTPAQVRNPDGAIMKMYREQQAVINEIESRKSQQARDQRTPVAAPQAGNQNTPVQGPQSAPSGGANAQNQTPVTGERVDIADLKDPNGKIGKQGFTEEGIKGITDHVLGKDFAKGKSLRETVDAIKSNPEAAAKVKKFLEESPVETTKLPDGTTHLKDGHHRAFLADQLGMKSLPTGKSPQKSSVSEDAFPDSPPPPPPLTLNQGPVQDTEPKDALGYFPKAHQEFIKEIKQKVADYAASLASQRSQEKENKKGKVDESTTLKDIISGGRLSDPEYNADEPMFDPVTGAMNPYWTKLTVSKGDGFETLELAPSEKRLPKGQASQEDIEANRNKGVGAEPPPTINPDGTLNVEQFLSTIPAGTPIGNLASLMKDVLPLMGQDVKSMKFVVSDNPQASGVTSNEDSPVVLGDGPGNYDAIGANSTVSEIMGAMLPRLVDVITSEKMTRVKNAIMERNAFVKGNQKTGWKDGDHASQAHSPSALEMRAIFEIAMPGAFKVEKGQSRPVKTAEQMKQLVVRGEFARIGPKNEEGVPLLPASAAFMDTVAAGGATYSDAPPSTETSRFHIQKTADGRMIYWEAKRSGWEKIPVTYPAKLREVFGEGTSAAKIASTYLRQVVASGHFDALFGRDEDTPNGKVFYDGFAATNLTKAEYVQRFNREGDTVPPYEFTSLNRFVAAMVGDMHFSMEQNKGVNWALPAKIRESMFRNVIGGMLGADMSVKTAPEEAAIIGAAKLAANAKYQKRAALEIANAKGIPGEVGVAGGIKGQQARLELQNAEPGIEDKNLQDATGNQKNQKYDDDQRVVNAQNEDIETEVSDIPASTQFGRSEEATAVPAGDEALEGAVERVGRREQAEGYAGSASLEDKYRKNDSVENDPTQPYDKDTIIRNNEESMVEAETFFELQLALAEHQGKLQLQRPDKRGEGALLNIVTEILGEKFMAKFNPTQSFRERESKDSPNPVTGDATGVKVAADKSSGGGVETSEGGDEMEMPVHETSAGFGDLQEAVISEEDQGSLALSYAVRHPSMTKKKIDQLLQKLGEWMLPAQVDEIAREWHTVRKERMDIEDSAYQAQRKKNEELSKAKKLKDEDIAALDKLTKPRHKKINEVYEKWRKMLGGRIPTLKQKEKRDGEIATVEAHALAEITPTGYDPKLSVQPIGAESFRKDIPEGEEPSFEHSFVNEPVRAVKPEQVLMLATDGGYSEKQLTNYIGQMSKQRVSDVHNGLVQLAKLLGVPLSDKDTYWNSRDNLRIKRDSLGVYGSLETALHILAKTDNPEVISNYLTKIQFPGNPGAQKLAAAIKSDPTLISDMHAMASGLMDSLAYKLKEKGQVVMLKNDAAIFGYGEEASFEREETHNKGQKGDKPVTGIRSPGERKGEMVVNPANSPAREFTKKEQLAPGVQGPPRTETKKSDAEGKEVEGPYVMMSAKTLTSDPYNAAKENPRDFKAGASRSFKMRPSRFSVHGGQPASARYVNGIQPFIKKGKAEIPITDDTKFPALDGQSVWDIFEDSANAFGINDDDKALYRIYKDIWRQALTTTPEGVKMLKDMRDKVNEVRGKTRDDVPLASAEVSDSRKFTPAYAISELINEYTPSKKKAPKKVDLSNPNTRQYTDEEDTTDYGTASDEDAGLNQPRINDIPRAQISINRQTGNHLITVFKGGDPTSLLHEMVHWMRFTKLQDGTSLFQTTLGRHYPVFMDWATEDGKHDMSTDEGMKIVEERIAEGAEQYFREIGRKGTQSSKNFLNEIKGRGPKLVNAFKKVANMFRRMYEGMKAFVILDKRARDGYNLFFGASERVLPTFSKPVTLSFQDIKQKDIKEKAQKLIEAAKNFGGEVTQEEAEEAIMEEEELEGSELVPTIPNGPRTPDDPSTLVLNQSIPSGMTVVNPPKRSKKSKLRNLYNMGQQKFARWFMATQGMDWEIFAAMKIKYGGSRQSFERHYLKNSNALTQAMNSYLKEESGYGAERSDLRGDIHRQVNGYLLERDPRLKAHALNALPTDAIRNAAATIRAHVDSLSDLLITSGIVQGPLAVVIDKNKGAYLHRAYDIIGNENRVMDLQHGHLNKLYLTAIRSIADIRNVDDATATGIANTILEAGSSSRAKFQGSDPRGKGLGAIMELQEEFQDVANARDLLWGLKEDPIFNYQNTVSQIGQLLHVNAALGAVLKYGTSGTDPLIIDAKQPNTSKTKQYIPFFGKADQVDPAQQPLAAHVNTVLAGWKASPEIVTFVKDMLEEMNPSTNNYLRIVNNLNGLFKVNATVNNWQTGFRNFYSSTMTMVANGHYSPQNWARAVQVVFKEGVGKELTPEQEALYEELQENNIAESATIAELRDHRKYDADIDKVYDAFLEGTSDSFKTLHELYISGNKTLAAIKSGSMKIYNGFDTIAKIAAYLGEKDKLRDMWPGKTETEIRELAAKRTHETMFSFDMSPVFMNFLRTRLPITAPFANFAWSMMRNSVNIMKVGIGDIREGNRRIDAGDPNGKKQRKYGYKRIGSYLATTFGGELAAMISAWMLGWDEEDMEALRETVTPFDRQGLLIPLSTKYDENLRYINVSNIMPYSVVSDVVMSMFRDDDASAAKKFKDAALGLLKPFLDEQYVVTAFRAISDKRNRYGEELNSLNEVVFEVMRPLFPGHLSNIARLNVGPDNAMGDYIGTITSTLGINPRRMNATEKALVSVGIKTNKAKKEDMIRFKAREWLGMIKAPAKEFSTTALEENNYTHEYLEGKLNSALDAQEKAIQLGWSTLDKFKSGFMMPPSQVEDILSEVTEVSGHVAGNKFNTAQREAMNTKGGVIARRLQVSTDWYKDAQEKALKVQPERVAWLAGWKADGLLLVTDGR